MNNKMQEDEVDAQDVTNGKLTQDAKIRNKKSVKDIEIQRM